MIFLLELALVWFFVPEPYCKWVLLAMSVCVAYAQWDDAKEEQRRRSL